MLLFKACYYIYFGPRLVQGISRKENFTVVIPSYAIAEMSLLEFFNYAQLTQPALFKMSHQFNSHTTFYTKDFSHIARLKAYNFSKSYHLPV